MPRPTPPRFWSPLFLSCAVVLLMAAVGFRPATSALIRYYSKERIDLRKPIEEFGVTRLTSFTPDFYADRHTATVEAVGTAEWTSMAFRENGTDAGVPPAVLFVTYYSDPRDNVPHTPEVCYRQAGATIDSVTKTRIATPGLEPRASEVEARLLHLTTPQGAPEVLVYLFCSNGRFYADREKLRWSIGLPGDKYTYFSKVEVVSPVEPDTDPQLTIDRCRKLLSEALPVLFEDHYPLDEDLGHR